MTHLKQIIKFNAGRQNIVAKVQMCIVCGRCVKIN